MRLFALLSLILTLLLVHFFLSGAQEVPTLSCTLSVSAINPGENAELLIDLNRLDEVASLELSMGYNPNLIQIQDRIPEQSDTINLSLGDLLTGNADIISSVDSASGLIQLDINRSNGDLLAASSGNVALASIAGLPATGLAEFIFQEATLTTFNGTQLPLGRVQDCWVDVGNSGAPTPTATTFGNSPLATVTASPTSNSPLPTLTPTPTPTLPAQPTATPSFTFTPAPTFTPSFTETPTPTPVESQVDVAQSPLETATPTETPLAVPSDTPTPFPSDTPTSAPLDTDTPTPTETPLPLPSDTPVPTFTPTAANATPNATLTPALIIVTPFRPTPTPEPLEVIVPQPPSDIEFVVQPDAPEYLTQRPPFRLFGFMALAGAILLTALGLVIRRSDS